MENENNQSVLSQMLRELHNGDINEETSIPLIAEKVSPMDVNENAPGDVIEMNETFDFDGYQVVRREFFAHTFEPSITFNNYKVYVNTACLNKFPNADFVQVLVNRDSKILAIRPCTEAERDAFAWCSSTTGKRKPKQITCKLFFAKIFELMEWNFDYRYKLLGKVIHANGEYLIAFDMTATEIYQRTEKDGKMRTSRRPVFPNGWKDQFGLPYKEHQKSLQINIFEGYAVYGIRENTISSVTAGAENVPFTEQSTIEPA